MKIVSIYQPGEAITAKLKDKDGDIFFAPVLFVAVTEDGKLIPCVGGKGNLSKGTTLSQTDVCVALDENYLEMVVD